MCGHIITEFGVLLFPFEKVRRASTRVKISKQDEFPDIRSSLRDTCHRFPEMRYLNIILESGKHLKGSATRVLEPLTVVRSVQADNINMPLIYADYLKCIIEGTDPSTHLSRHFGYIRPSISSNRGCRRHVMLWKTLTMSDSKGFGRLWFLGSGCSGGLQ